jgi:hypothetical protein
VQGCGHRFCLACIRQWVGSRVTPLCPVCRAEVKVLLLADGSSEVRAARVLCAGGGGSADVRLCRRAVSSLACVSGSGAAVVACGAGAWHAHAGCSADPRMALPCGAATGRTASVCKGRRCK